MPSAERADAVRMAAGPGAKAECGIRVSLPEAGVIRVESERTFSALDGALCRRFLQAALRPPAIEDAILAPTPTHSVDLRYNESRHLRNKLLEELAFVPCGAKLAAVAALAAARDRRAVVRYRR